MEELTAIKTADGREFKPWVDADKLQQIVSDPSSVTAITSEIASGKQAVAEAINAKGGTASATESFQELAQDISEIDWNQNDGFIFTPTYNPKNIGDFISNIGYLTEIDDNTISSIPEYFFAPFLLKVHYITLRNPLLETIYFIDILNGTGLITPSGIQHLTFPNAKYLSFNIPTQGVSVSNNIRLDIKAPSATRVTGAYLFWLRPNILVNLEVGTLVELSFKDNTGQVNLRNITIGNGVDINLAFQFWTATNVIAEGQNGIDELNSNLYNNLLIKLYDHSQDGVTRTLSIGWLANVSAENIAYANAKGWTLTT